MAINRHICDYNLTLAELGAIVLYSSIADGNHKVLGSKVFNGQENVDATSNLIDKGILKMSVDDGFLDVEIDMSILLKAND